MMDSEITLVSRRVFISDIHLTNRQGIKEDENGVILSDPHTLSVREVDKFQRFLLYLKKEIKGLDEIVIVGDFLDEWSVPLNQEPPTYDDILSAGHNKKIVDRINELLESGVDIKYIRGNHDMTVTQGVLNRHFVSKPIVLVTEPFYDIDEIIRVQHGHMKDWLNCPVPNDQELRPMGYILTRIKSMKNEYDGKFWPVLDWIFDELKPFIDDFFKVGLKFKLFKGLKSLSEFFKELKLSNFFESLSKSLEDLLKPSKPFRISLKFFIGLLLKFFIKLLEWFIILLKSLVFYGWWLRISEKRRVMRTDEGRVVELGQKILSKMLEGSIQENLGQDEVYFPDDWKWPVGVSDEKITKISDFTNYDSKLASFVKGLLGDPEHILKIGNYKYLFDNQAGLVDHQDEKIGIYIFGHTHKCMLELKPKSEDSEDKILSKPRIIGNCGNWCDEETDDTYIEVEKWKEIKSDVCYFLVKLFKFNGCDDVEMIGEEYRMYI